MSQCSGRGNMSECVRVLTGLERERARDLLYTVCRAYAGPRVSEVHVTEHIVDSKTFERVFRTRQ